MREYLETIDTWLARGERVAVATVVRTTGSSPRQVGAKLFVSSSGAMAGSVSGGCIEGAVFVACQEALATGEARLLRFGVADEMAWEVGLACGGTIEVLVEPLREPVRAERPMATVTVIRGPSGPGARLLIEAGGSVEGSLGDAGLDQAAVHVAQEFLTRGASGAVELAGGKAAVFIESFVPPPSLYMVGGVHIATALARMANVLGLRTVVVDPRAAFASQERFAHVDEVVLAWPDEALEGRLDARSCVAVLTHDPRLDDPALRVALRSPARYIGALGGRAAHARRLERLRAEGFSEADLARVHGPIGLPIGAKTPEEIAVSILAQIIQVQREGSRLPDKMQGRGEG
ncbi:MAG: XdhC family protein [Oscillochloridaceae bacterium]|nr:XdhC family protein [Chloroflexaceae bacterium]MDW8389976.1 XdhC family protein [Oscillochloridaceae bacterium]